MATNKKMLNLGCGNKPFEGAINHDLIKHSDHIDIAHDLNVMPWPWEDDCFDHIIAYSVLEHIDHNLLVCMNEVWRILRPNGLLSIKLPYWNCEVTWNDPTHKRGYGLGIFNQFDVSTDRGKDYSFYTDRKWKIVKKPYLNPSGTSLLAKLRKIGP